MMGPSNKKRREEKEEGGGYSVRSGRICSFGNFYLKFLARPFYGHRVQCNFIFFSGGITLQRVNATCQSGRVR